MVDIFERLEKNTGGPIGQYMQLVHGYFAFPKLEGELGPHMRFRGKMMLNWSLNNYLGLANHPEVRKADAAGAQEFGMAAPMGARMMSGQTKYHEQLERELAEFVGKEDAFLLNFGYQGMISIIDCLLTPRDVVVYDAECHACIIDGLRMHKGKRFVYAPNNEESLRLQLKHATDLAEEQRGGVLVITEGVFGMKGDLGFLDVIVKAKKDFNFRLLVDDAHGFDLRLDNDLHVGQAVDVLVEHVLDAVLLDVELADELVAALERGLELHVEARYNSVGALLMELGEAHSVGKQKLMAGVLDVVLVVGVVNYALKVAFVVAHLHFEFVDVFVVHGCGISLIGLISPIGLIGYVFSSA